MTIEQLPRRIALGIAEVAASIREGTILRLDDGRASGEEIEMLADDLISEGIDTPAARLLVAPPRFRPFDEALALFEQLLDELGCPTVASLADWWPEERFVLRFPITSREVGSQERLWRAICELDPQFSLIYDPLETNYYTALVYAQHFAREFRDEVHDPDLRRVFEFLVDRLRDEDVSELIGAGILKYLARELAGFDHDRQTALAVGLTPSARRVWAEITEPAP